MVDAVFSDRVDAGRTLAEALERYQGRPDVMIIALPRGGVPVGFEVARRLDVPLDVIVVRKLGAPGHEELAMGAVASGGIVVRNDDVISMMGIDDHAFTTAVAAKRHEVEERERLFRGETEAIAIRDKVVIVVDDGVATGSTISAALSGLRQLEPAGLVVAVPVAPPEAVAALSGLADDVVALRTPSPFHAVGFWYRDFRQVPDSEVHRLLSDPESSRPGD